MDKSQYNILDSIKYPEDLRKLSQDQLPEVCREIRSFLIRNLANNPGHFGSSMGAVDLIVALHYVFNTPRDRIVWDVGHQAYAHKILTGRKELFEFQRTHNGISGFPFPKESEYDTFVCGHAGNSISAALGMSVADQNTSGEEDRKTIAVIGDSSISNGIAFEGLNNTSNQPNNLLIILNDNDMSIDDPVGALHKYLSDITTSAPYNRWRLRIYNLFKRFGLINDRRKGLLLRFNNALKALISAQQNIFEGLNIRYFGPFDGNDVCKIVKVLNDIKDMTGPRILHLHTVKGKGFEVAEKNPQAWHAPGNFDPDTGEKISKNKVCELWQEAFGRNLVSLAEGNSSVVGISAAMLSGTSMSLMMERFPERTFDVGISEGHAVTFAGGLAAAGKTPFVAIYSSFLQRAFDNIIHDVAIQGLPVVFCIDRAGIVGEDGVTHHGMFDIAYLRIIPNMNICAPMDVATLANVMKLSLSFASPLAIRYPRGKVIDFNNEITEFNSDELCLSTEICEVGKARKILDQQGARTVILSVGPICLNALKAAAKLRNKGILVDIYDMVWIKPLDYTVLLKVAHKYEYLFTLEDGAINGGFGSAVSEWMSDNGFNKRVIRLGIPDNWVYQGSIGELQNDCGFDVDGIIAAVEKEYL